MKRIHKGCLVTVLLLCAVVATFYIFPLPLLFSLPKGPAEIYATIQENYGAEYLKLIQDAGLKEIRALHVRVYKEERELELWAGENDESFRLIKTFEICAMDFDPGPKLREGDGRTPEGSYALTARFGSRNWFMHINLSPKRIDWPGIPMMGSVFFYCSDYPKSVDRERSRSIGIKTPGSAICVHGNCVSSGCPSLENRDFVELFYFLQHHDVDAYGKPMITILPFRFENITDMKQKAADAAQINPESAKLGADAILLHWQTLEREDAAFRNRHSGSAKRIFEN